MGLSARIWSRALSTITTGSGTGRTKRTINQPESTSSPYSLADGTGSGQANDHCVRTVALSASTPQTLDLTSIVDDNGETHTFTKIKYARFRCTSEDGTEKVTVGNAASDPWTPGFSAATTTFEVYGASPPVEFANFGSGWDCQTATDLKLDPGSDALTIEIILIGLT